VSAFETHLNEICERADDVVVACVMGLDGLAIETVRQGELEDQVDADALFVEFSSILSQIRERTDGLVLGQIEEMSIQSGNITTILRLINSDYFIAAAVLPKGNLGKARYLLRVQAPKMIGELQ